MRILTARGVLCVALAIAPAVVSGQQLAGITFAITTTALSPADTSVQSGKGWVAGSQMRLDIRGSAAMGPGAAGMSGENMSFLVRRDSLQQNVMTVINHDEKSYMLPGKMLEQMTAMMGSLPPEMRPRISLEARNISVDTLGPGETISGFTTIRYKIGMELVVNVQVMDEKHEQVMRVESDALYSEALSEFSILGQWSRSYESMLSGMLGGDTTAVAQFRRMEAAFPKGIPLRSEDRISMSDMPGVLTRTELSNIVRTSFSQSVFDIPAGYTEATIPTTPSLN